jgi:predicted HTH domain antitoxin
MKLRAKVLKMKNQFKYMMEIKKLEVPLMDWIDEKEAKIALASELYREGKVTLKQAGEIADLTVWDILYEFGKRKISYTNITVEDLHEEIESI